MAKITVQNTSVTVISVNDEDYISLTDMANAKESESRAADIIRRDIRSVSSRTYNNVPTQ